MLVEGHPALTGHRQWAAMEVEEVVDDHLHHEADGEEGAEGEVGVDVEVETSDIDHDHTRGREAGHREEACHDRRTAGHRRGHHRAEGVVEADTTGETRRQDEEDGVAAAVVVEGGEVPVTIPTIVRARAAEAETADRKSLPNTAMKTKAPATKSFNTDSPLRCLKRVSSPVPSNTPRALPTYTQSPVRAIQRQPSTRDDIKRPTCLHHQRARYPPYRYIISQSSTPLSLAINMRIPDLRPLRRMLIGLRCWMRGVGADASLVFTACRSGIPERVTEVDGVERGHDELFPDVIRNLLGMHSHILSTRHVELSCRCITTGCQKSDTRQTPPMKT